MKQKGSTTTNTILIIVIIVLAIVLGYVMLVKKTTPVSIEEQPVSETGQPATSTIATSTPQPTSSPVVVNHLPTSCTDEQEGTPVITSLSSYSGSVGTKVELRGCNFAGFEGDKNAWIENSAGVKGFLQGSPSSTSKLIVVTLQSPLCQKDTSYSGLPCDAELTLKPGTYKISTSPWGKKSNEVLFTIR
jgi:hypothetical protein